MCRDMHRQRGFTLLELIVTVSLVATFAAVAIARLSSSTQANLSTNGDARRLALDLLQAQRRAISTGNNHYVEFTTSGGTIVSYTLYQRQGGSNVVADATHTFNTQITVTTSATDLEYQFDGTALASYTVTLAGPNMTYQVAVTASTGNVKVTKQ